MQTSNHLPKEAIEEFKKLYKKRFNKDLTNDEAQESAIVIYELYDAVYGKGLARKT